VPNACGKKWQTVRGIIARYYKVIREIMAVALDQENIGRQMLHHVEKLRVLREDIDAGVRSLDAGKGHELDLNDMLSVARQRHERPR
jgi:hypothetical protein